MSSQIAHRRVNITTNSFPIRNIPNQVYTQYEVFSPDFPKGAFKKKKQYLHHLQTTVAASSFSRKFLYDGGAVAYAHPDLVRSIGPTKVFYVDLRSDTPFDASQWSPTKSPCIKITFSKTSGVAIRPDEVNDIVQNTPGTDTQRREIVTNFLQLIVRQGTNNMYVNNNKSYFPGGPGEQTMLSNGLEIRRGIFHSVRPTIGRMVVTIDTTATAFFRGGPLIDIIGEFLLKDKRYPRLDKTDQQFRTMEHYFKGLHIKVPHGKTPNATKSIKGFMPKGGLYEFEHQEGRTTVQEHYFRTHNIRLRYPEAPGVILRKEPRLILVPLEVCHLVPNQIFRKALPEQYTGDMVKFASMPPGRRFEKIKNAATKYPQCETMQESGMSIDTTPVTVDGLVLETPMLGYGRESVKPADGKWNVMRKRFNTPAKLENWAVLNCATMELGSNVQGVVDSILECSRNLGMAPDPPLAVMDWTSGRMTMSLDNIMRASSQAFGRKHQGAKTTFNDNKVLQSFILIILLPSEAAGPRNELKHWGDVSFGIKTQCLRANKLNRGRPNSQYSNNVVLKLNARLGGVNHVVTSVALNRLKKFPYMIVGADVGHPGPGVNKPSTTGLVFSWDRDATKFAAITGIQEPRCEPIVDIKKMFTTALKGFRSANKCAPLQIVYFRDGVSEGEYRNIATLEMGAIKEAFTDMELPEPKITFIVVTKRHHTLLFPESGQRSEINDGKGNCKAGVAVDTGVTQPFVHNFYLQSHAAIQGTSRSSHYIVLHDDIFDTDILVLEELAFALCHVYAKATRSVSIPAPVYYADLVCQRANFHFDPSKSLSHLEDTSSVHTSGGTEKKFVLEPWKKAFKNLHHLALPSMYFL